MRGKYRVVVQNKKIKYDFVIRRNITVIRGDSATGKTALVDLIREYSENAEDSGIILNCKKNCAVLEGKNWLAELGLLRNSIVFIDEGNRFVTSKEFSAAIQKTDNYYVIVTRESLYSLPYSVDEIYGIRNSGKYGHLKQTYNEMYHIYSPDFFKETVNPEVVLVEDSHAGYQFFEDVCRKNHLLCESADGKSNVFSSLVKLKDKNVVVIADGAAFGAEMERVMALIKNWENVILYLPESFEWLILKSDLLEDGSVREILLDPSEYIDSEEYFSWERYFSQLLVRKSDDGYLKYSKNVLNSSYLEDSIEKKVLSVIDKIDFSWKEKSND